MTEAIDYYLSDQCKASSLPFWKTELIQTPDNIQIVRDDEFSAEKCNGRDEPYFKAVHDLNNVGTAFLPSGFEPIECDISDFAGHINECYSDICISIEELSDYQNHPVYDPKLWIAVAKKESGKIVATGIGELDKRIDEGILEWIQVSPEFRNMGLGHYIVNELLHRMQKKAKFVTVSGKINDSSNPLSLYKSCGFRNPVIWHVLEKKQ